MRGSDAKKLTAWRAPIRPGAVIDCWERGRGWRVPEGTSARKARIARAASPEARSYLAKAHASLRGADLEMQAQLFDGAVNRAYYACYQAAVAALVAEGIPPVVERFWPHDVVQAQFPSILVDSLQRYPPWTRGTLKAIFDERLKADYEPDDVSPETAAEAVRRAGEFLAVVADRVAPR